MRDINDFCSLKDIVYRRLSTRLNSKSTEHNRFFVLNRVFENLFIRFFLRLVNFSSKRKKKNWRNVPRKNRVSVFCVFSLSK